jgi:hypothetical protein
MKPRAWLFAATMSFASLALAQTPSQSTVAETTDPAKIAEIERHAQELASRTPSSSATATSSGEQHEAGKHHDRHHAHKGKHTRSMKGKPPSDRGDASGNK